MANEMTNEQIRQEGKKISDAMIAINGYVANLRANNKDKTHLLTTLDLFTFKFDKDLFEFVAREIEGFGL